MISLLLPLFILAPAELVRLDFTQAPDNAAWVASHDLAELRTTPEGVVFELTGSDPYSVGPELTMPADTPLWLTARLFSESGGRGEVFWADPNFRAGAAMSFHVPKAEWTEVKVPLPALPTNTRLRFDPPGSEGTCTLAWMALSERTLRATPEWPRPTAEPLPGGAPSLTSGELVLTHHPSQAGDFELRWAQTVLARGHNQPRLAYTDDNDQPQWLDLSAAETTVRGRGGRLEVTTRTTDPAGAEWTWTTIFARGRQAQRIDVEVRLATSADRWVDYAPLLMLMPGLGGYGPARNQALLAGSEYLDAPDSSSSEDDLEGEQSQRQVVDIAKFTQPLMAVQAQGRWLSLAWELQPDVCALFDSPDRQFGSGAHVMGLLYPGSDGSNRPESSLFPYSGKQLNARQPLVLRATINAGEGGSIVPAIETWVAQNRLPALPRFDRNQYLLDTAAGWLDTPIREGNRWRHAWWPGILSFGPQASADGAVYMDWLAGRVRDRALADRLRQAALDARNETPGAGLYHSSIGHVVYPVPPLVYGAVSEMLRAAGERGQQVLGLFEPDGRVLYRQDPDRPDYGRTHFAPDANGLTSGHVERLLEAAIVTGDDALAQEGLKRLRALQAFDNSVPRGAQTWECPLHTPDILASARLVRCFTMGYELTGDTTYLDRAKYWAWTGVPFVYLAQPTGGPFEPYATIAVYGATNWVAPNWMGRPVQWCGLVYADALSRLAEHDPNPVWTQLASGITISGILQNFQANEPDLVGLLPDSVVPRTSERLAVAINPGTVQANAIRLLDGEPVYDHHIDRLNQLTVHAPGGLTLRDSQPGRLRLRLATWAAAPAQILVVGQTAGWELLVDGRPAPPPAEGETWLMGPVGRDIELRRTPANTR